MTTHTMKDEILRRLSAGERADRELDGKLGAIKTALNMLAERVMRLEQSKTDSWLDEPVNQNGAPAAAPVKRGGRSHRLFSKDELERLFSRYHEERRQGGATTYSISTRLAREFGRNCSSLYGMLVRLGAPRDGNKDKGARLRQGQIEWLKRKAAADKALNPVGAG